MFYLFHLVCQCCVLGSTDLAFMLFIIKGLALSSPDVTRDCKAKNLPLSVFKMSSAAKVPVQKLVKLRLFSILPVNFARAPFLICCLAHARKPNVATPRSPVGNEDGPSCSPAL